MNGTRINEQLLEQKLADLESQRSWSPRVVSKLEAFIRSADDLALFRINPLTSAASKPKWMSTGSDCINN